MKRKVNESFPRRRGNNAGGGKRLAQRTGAVLGPVLASGTGRTCREKGLPALSRHEPVARLP